jgi:hypothetical protein
LIQEVVPSAKGCEECLAVGDTWVHLRMCMTVATSDAAQTRRINMPPSMSSGPITLS